MSIEQKIRETENYLKHLKDEQKRKKQSIYAHAVTRSGGGGGARAAGKRTDSRQEIIYENKKLCDTKFENERTIKRINEIILELCTQRSILREENDNIKNKVCTEKRTCLIRDCNNPIYAEGKCWRCANDEFYGY